MRAERSSIQRHFPCVHRPASVTGTPIREPALDRLETRRLDVQFDCSDRRFLGCLLYMAGVCLFRGREFSVDGFPGVSVQTFETLVPATYVTTIERVDGIRRHYCESAAEFLTFVSG